MTAFVIVCSAMVAAALLWLLLPLLRHKSAAAEPQRRAERRTSVALVAVLVPALAAVMYSDLSDWDFDAAEQQVARAAEAEALLQQLEAKLRSNPQDVEGWLLLGRSYAAMERFPQAVIAYQHAYDASNGDNVDAIIGLGETLAMADETALTGRAGELFDAALAKAPNHPKALWYGSIAALQAGDLRTGRDRLQMLLAQNPPQELRGVLERQIQDLDQQLAEAGEGGASVAGERSISVSVSIAPEIQKQLTAELPLFILARDSAGGPPLAVQRHSSAATPLTVKLSERDAMMPTRTLASVPRVQVVARISRSGAPQARSGDFYGEADYAFDAASGDVSIVIDKIVP